MPYHKDLALVVKLVNTTDLKSVAYKACGFESHLGHQGDHHVYSSISMDNFVSITPPKRKINSMAL